jgi:hypothetical protein
LRKEIDSYHLNLRRPILLGWMGPLI